MDFKEQIKFHYEALANPKTQIRLLTLLAGNPEDSIRCTLRNVELDPNNRYAALSYAWGSPNGAQTIIINGRTLTIFPNLYNFLLRLRSPECDRVLWADAICINQNDDKGEKGPQVDMMGRIYSYADEVLVWLGESADRSNEVMDALPGLPTHSSLGISYREKLVKTFTDADLIIPFRELCERNYWTRQWIIQEICLGKSIKIHCGDRVVLWDNLEPVINEWPVDENPESVVRQHDLTSFCLPEYEQPSRLGFQAYKIPIYGLRNGDAISQSTCHNPLALFGPDSPRPPNAYQLCRRRDGVEAMKRGGSNAEVRSNPARLLVNLRMQTLYEPLTLESLIYYNQPAQCGDIRDRVFGMLGLAADFKELNCKSDPGDSFHANYSWDRETLLCKTVEFCKPKHPFKFRSVLRYLLQLEKPEPLMEPYSTITVYARGNETREPSGSLFALAFIGPGPILISGSQIPGTEAEYGCLCICNEAGAIEDANRFLQSSLKSSRLARFKMEPVPGDDDDCFFSISSFNVLYAFYIMLGEPSNLPHS